MEKASMDKRQWFRAKPDADNQPMRRNSQTNKDRQELTRAEADLSEAERRIARQIVLIDELKHGGDEALEPVKALARLEMKMLETRDRHQQLLSRLT